MRSAAGRARPTRRCRTVAGYRPRRRRRRSLRRHPPSARPCEPSCRRRSTGRSSTAAILNDHLDAGPLYLDADLIERDAGEWSGLTRAEIEAGFPGYLNDGRRPHGYEADHSVRDRVLGALDRVVARFLRTGNTNNRATDDRPEVVVVVTHGGVIYAVENHLDAPFERKPNLGARFIVASGEGLRLGHSVLLLDAATATSPDLL